MISTIIATMTPPTMAATAGTVRPRELDGGMDVKHPAAWRDHVLNVAVCRMATAELRRSCHPDGRERRQPAGGEPIEALATIYFGIVF
jgi:hypothetical protein